MLFWLIILELRTFAPPSGWCAQALRKFSVKGHQFTQGLMNKCIRTEYITFSHEVLTILQLDTFVPNQN